MFPQVNLTQVLPLLCLLSALTFFILGYFQCLRVVFRYIDCRANCALCCCHVYGNYSSFIGYGPCNRVGAKSLFYISISGNVGRGIQIFLVVKFNERLGPLPRSTTHLGRQVMICNYHRVHSTTSKMVGVPYICL